MDWKNKLYFGDNLGILREHVATESIDLIYLDPPFNSSATYNVPFKEKSKDHKKGADSGIDGYINFFDDTSVQAKKVIVQVKSGYIGVNHVRDLKGVLAREKADIGALITLREPTKPMQVEAASAGFYEPKEFPGRYPRVQILTVAELLEGKKIQFPEHRVETFAKAERKTRHQQEELF